MKIATFNVNSIWARKDLIIKWLTEKVDIDVLYFQEIKCIEEDFPFADFEDIGYHCEVSGEKAYNGVAICSKYDMSDVHKGLGGYWDQQKRFIRAKVQGIDIINIYAPHGDISGEKHMYKLEFFNFLKKYIVENFDIEKDLFCVVGDMNVAREDIDVWSPQILKGTIGFMDDEREAFEDFLSVGLTDTYRKFHTDTHGFTWWGYKNAAVWKDKGMRIDYILTSKELAKRCQICDIDMWTRKRRTPTPSDHAPLVANFTSKKVNKL